jgi:WD40 repeat protein
MPARRKIMDQIIMPRLGKIAKRETVLKDEKVFILTPDTDSGRIFGEQVKEKISPYTSRVTVLNDGSKDLFKESALFIVAGNLVNNPCVRYLYYKSYVITDLCYPGPGGYEVRTLLDPFGKGKNILFIGFSDEEGFQKGARIFLERITCDTVPFLRTVYYTRLPVTDKTFKRLAESKEPDNISLLPSAHVNNWYMKAWLAYATGEQQYADDYIRAWKKLLMYAEQNPDEPGLSNSTCIGMSAHSGSFWIAIHGGIIPEDLQEDIEKVLYRWMCSRFGSQHAASYKDTRQPPHNITMFVALACTYLSEYFIKTYGMNETLQKVVEIAKRPFEYFSSGHWRPYCDDSSYSLSVSLPLAIAYSFFEENNTFLNTSFKDAKPFILSMHMPSGFIPSIGDGGVAKLASTVCRTYAYYYKDGQIQALCDREPDKSRLDPTGFTLPFRAFCGVKPEPEDLNKDDLSVLALNRWHYEASAAKSEEGKIVPYHKAFDKISMRKFTKSGWDYLLIDGLGIETHCKNNTLAILDLSINGISCFVEESGYRWPDRESCTTVTVSGKGYSGMTPELACLDRMEQTDETLYIKATVPGFNGTDWTRELFLVYGKGAVIHDTFKAYREDDYVFYSHFRIPAEMKADGNAVRGIRIGQNGEEYEQITASFSSFDPGVSVEFIDIGSKKFESGDMGEPWYKKPEGPDAMDMWKERYGSDKAVITKYTSFVGAKMKAEDTVSVTHLLQVRRPGADNAYFDQTEDAYWIVFPDEEEHFKEYALPFTPALFSDEPVRSLSATEDGEPVTVKTKKAFKKNIKGCTVTEKGNILAFYDNIVRYFNKRRSLVFEQAFPGNVRSVAAIDLDENRTVLAVGYDNKNIRVLDGKGNLLWETEILRRPTMLSSWETKYPKVFSLCFVKTEDSYRLFAGCGDNHVKLFDDKGNLLNTLFADYRIIDRMIADDVDQDGNTEVMAYASDEASSGILYIYDENLNVKYKASAGGWLYTVKAAAYAHMNQKTYFAVGVNTNNTLSVYELSSGKLNLLFSKDIAGANTAVCFDTENKVLYAGSDKGYIKAFDLTGSELYSCYVNMPVLKLAVCNGQLYAVSDKKLLRTDLSLNVTGSLALPSKLLDLIRKDDSLLLVLERGIHTVL